MIIIREAAIDWNRYGCYESKFKLESASEMTWHLQSWQSWLPEDSTKRIDNTDICDCGLKYSFFCLSKTFGDNTIIWNTASESIIALSANEKAELDIFLKTGQSNDLDVSTLFNQGILVLNDDDEFSKFDYIRNRAATKEDKAKNFIIIPTTECNARCFYCFAQEDLKDQKRMSTQTADEVIRFLISQVSEEEEIIFRWFGGEPLIAADIIDYIITSLDSHYLGKLQYHSIITSNTSILTDSMIDKAINCWHLKKIHLTIDGYKNEHDQRKRYMASEVDQYSFLLERIQLLLEKGVYTIVRLNLDKHNFESIDLILDDLAIFKDYGNFFVHLTNLQPHVEGKTPSRYFLYTDYPTFYRVIYDKLLSKGFYKSIDALVPKRQMTLCTAGLNNFILINNVGNLYKCDKECHNQANCIGNCKVGIVHNRRLSYWMDTMLATECRSCKFLPICQGGCKFYRESENSNLTPCIKQRYFSDTILELINDYFLR